MAGRKRFAVNVLMNWFATGVSLLVPFFLTPFVVRSLGPAAYGVWILSVSTVSYLNLLDLGMRSAIIRFVSRAQARQETSEIKSTVGAALWFRVLLSSVVALLSALLAVLFPHLFKVPAELEHAAQVTVLLCALGVAATLISGVFGAVLAAIHRFDLLSTVSMCQTLARAAGVLVILSSGRGLVSLAIWEIAVISLAGCATIVIAIRTFPDCRVRLTRPNMAALRGLWSYSFITFIWIIANQVIISTDNLVVGAFVSVGLVSFYSIGSSLLSYSGQLTSALSTTFTPMASGMEANGHFDKVRELLLRGTQSTLAIALPVCVALLFRGRTFIGLWMGPSYMEVSGNVLHILMISQYFAIGSSTAGSIMMAISKHKPVAYAALIEAILNLGATLLVVRSTGIYGVAWATALAMALVHLVFWPPYLRKTLNMPILPFLWEGWGKITLCALPFAAVCAVADATWHPHNLGVFFLQVLLTLPVYALTLLIVFRGEAMNLFHKWRASRLQQTPLPF
jgi:O-antigen/teichoic acid export membrane protein